MAVDCATGNKSVGNLLLTTTPAARKQRKLMMRNNNSPQAKRSLIVALSLDMISVLCLDPFCKKFKIYRVDNVEN
jgi:hypothetical protein